MAWPGTMSTVLVIKQLPNRICMGTSVAVITFIQQLKLLLRELDLLAQLVLKGFPLTQCLLTLVRDLLPRTHVCFQDYQPTKKEYVTKKFRTDCTFHTPEELRDKMYETFDDNLPESREFELGFYRGRGGSKTSILDEEDMTSMYEYYSNPAQEISLWCHGKFGSDEDQPESFQGQSRKRKNEDAST